MPYMTGMASDGSGGGHTRISHVASIHAELSPGFNLQKQVQRYSH